VLFYTDKSLAAHYCTASVVHSPTGDVVITAAHCVFGSDYKTGFAFVPGYHDGESPYGQWTPAQTVVSSAWRTSNDPDEDVAFLVMDKSSAGQSIESVVGADQIAFGQGFGQTVTVPAYPAGSPTPITCTDIATEFSATQLRWNCAGYPGGTSGAPLLVGGNRGTVVGVIGGYETGGDTPDVSYSSYFGDTVARLYQQAAAAG
jgi:V8-like Glu-specific endopeptidase